MERNTCERHVRLTEISVILLLETRAQLRLGSEVFLHWSSLLWALMVSVVKTYMSSSIQKAKPSTRLEQQERWTESEWKTASNLTYLRRQLSVCIVTGVAESLLTRLQQAGNPGRGARQAAQRRAQALGREERGRRERAAHWLLHTRGYRVLQRGQFLNH